MNGDCVRCGEQPGIDDLGYCGHCHRLARAEVNLGLRQLERYLAAWAAFRAWESFRFTPRG
jgi:hypothetical protein